MRLISRATPLFVLLILVSSCLAGPNLRPLEREFHFGSVGIDFKIFHDFKLVNHGSEPIHIDTVDPHCDCTFVRFLDSTVQPNDTATIRMIFNTADFYGPVSKSLIIHSNDKAPQEFKVWYHATIGQWLYKVQPDPVSLFFLPVHKSRTLTLTNHALEFIELDRIELLDDIVTIRPLRSRVDEGEAIEFEVTADPDLGPGEHATNFTAQFRVPEGLEPLRITIPVKIVRY